MIELTGFLRCRDSDEAERVRALLPEHIALTRAEPGCLKFTVEPDADGLNWAVSERFVDNDAFEAHQARASESAWAKGTQGIPRHYSVTGQTPREETPSGQASRGSHGP